MLGCPSRVTSLSAIPGTANHRRVAACGHTPLRQSRTHHHSHLPSRFSPEFTHVCPAPRRYCFCFRLRTATGLHPRGVGVLMAAKTGYAWDDVPLEEEMGPLGSRLTFKNKQGLDMAGYLFPAKGDAKAVLYLLHGHGCNLPYEFLASRGTGKWHVYSGSWVEHLNNSGYSVCGIDLQGHGRSSGLHGLRFYFDSFAHLVDDVLQFQSEHVDKTDGFKGLPTFLGGISMGGCLATEVLHKTWHEGIFRGGVLLAPMLSLERVSRELVNRILRPISSLMNIIAPTLAIVKVTENTMYPQLQEEFNIDPHTSGGTNTRVRVAVEYLNVTARIMSTLQDMNFDFVAFHSEKDGLTDPDGSKALYSKSCAKHKTLTLLDSMWHYLTHEEGNMNVLRSCISWMDEQISSSASPRV